MRPHSFASPLSRALTCCVAAFIGLWIGGWSAARAQVFQRDHGVGFADHAICQPTPLTIPAKLATARDATADSAIQLEADSIQVENRPQNDPSSANGHANDKKASDGANNDAGGTITLSGSGEILRGASGVFAERMVYDQATRQAHAAGGVVLYASTGDQIHADTMDLAVDTFAGEARGITLLLAARDSPDKSTLRARATAQEIAFTSRDFARLQEVAMTTCTQQVQAAGKPDVQLLAKEIVLDHAKGEGRAKSMKVKFKSVPIFYFPKITFPIGDQRKSGFLFPELGYADDSGWVVATPWYLNIAPQYDARVTPRVLTRRGNQIYGQFRYLGANGQGMLRGEVLPSDARFGGRERHRFGYDHHQQFGDQWSGAIALDAVSDADYLRDFADAGGSAEGTVAKKARLDRFGENLRFNAHAVAYDTVSQDANDPYQILPAAQLDFVAPPWGGFAVGATVQYARFRNPNAVPSAPINAPKDGTRLRAKYHISVPIRSHWGYLLPKVSTQFIRYSLDAPKDIQGMDETPSVKVPIFSVDGGLFLERAVAAGTQTLEPRLLYVRIPTRPAQDDFPRFDVGTGSGHSLGHFFRENRFIGGDRVGDTEHIAVGLTSRILDRGRQRLGLSLAQVFYRQDRVLQLANAAPETADTSGILGEFAFSTPRWKVAGFARWDENRFASGRLSADYHRDQRHSASVGYFFDAAHKLDKTQHATDSEQVNLTFNAPVARRWQVRGHTAYSLERDEIHAAGVDFSVDGCCWAVRFGAARYLDGAGAHKNRFLITLELDDLGRISSRL